MLYGKLISKRKTHVKHPAMMPALPKPETARPRMSMADATAVPEIRDPISKIITEIRNTTFSENML